MRCGLLLAALRKFLVLAIQAQHPIYRGLMNFGKAANVSHIFGLFFLNVIFLKVE